ncbi:response regulator [Halioglobus maricola]|uniref:Response regulator n=1 Tax=Halioglobus maricola TaxID=2601894 RepID=A0A5P9NN26_9GAMM|nr:ATP-binding protein [Halioglobus maricola]QFU77162.1 response regulator [Halioglobus maricola]
MRDRRVNELEQLQRLFSIVMCVDRDLRIVHASETLQRFVPALEKEAPLFELFKLQRPRSVNDFDTMCEHMDSLFMMQANDDSFAIRGQVILLRPPGGDLLCFCGSPWLLWLTTNRPELNLGLGDFAPQDAQLDQLFYMSTEKQMVADLELLNSELNEAKEKLEALQVERNAFFAQMSHEMRTPLNGVVSALALLQGEQLSESADKLVQLGHKSSKNLMQVINYVLDVAKIEATESQGEVEFELGLLLEESLDTVRASAQEKGLEARIDLVPQLPLGFRGDAERLRQALLNLLVNAVKFTQTGGVTLRACPGTVEGQAVRIEVIDSGAGIHPDDVENVFQPYWSRVDDKQPIGQSGTGLGLDIVRRNVEAMGGILGVTSQQGRGSTFWLELPLEQLEARELDVAAGTESVPQASLSGRVLLVDDNETNLMLGSMILGGLGLSVTTVSSGEEAVERAAGHDLILMDINMPGIDGLEATRRIRASVDVADVPVLALTAYASSLERVAATEAGMNDYLTKPVDRGQLTSALAKWLSPDPAAPVQAVANVDRDVFDSLLAELGTKNLRRVLEKFAQESAKRSEALSAAASAKEVAHEAHTLSSTCGSFGLVALAGELAELEVRAKGGVCPPENELRDYADRIGKGAKALVELASA